MNTPIETFDQEKQTVELIQDGRERIYAELSKVIVGQHDVIEQLLIALFAGGNCLITGAPGLAKTLLVRSIAQVFHLKFQRIQFTPDLMPSDITGTQVLEEKNTNSATLNCGKTAKLRTFYHGPVHMHNYENSCITPPTIRIAAPLTLCSMAQRVIRKNVFF